MRDKLYFSYTRVSTIRQGQTGTSLSEQEDAIDRYAHSWHLPIVKRFEEQETAAKLGRPVFAEMLKALKQGKADGIIIHKIDRSARNLKDWADLGELIDRGIEVHFANESLDLQSRGGRLSADIQAVVAADYIRNLREETRKGFYGRIKQGLYPRPAPVGYLDMGKGKPKEPDPVQAPLVRQAFELYASGRYGLKALVETMYELGLRSKQGNKVTLNGMSSLLHNAFYSGLIALKNRGELFRGAHPPIVAMSLFDEVQAVLSGKHVEKKQRNFFIFRKLLLCAECQTTLIGERHKGHAYYRCQNRSCSQTSIREEVVEAAFVEMLSSLRFNDVENRYFREEIKKLYQTATTFREVQTKALSLQLDQSRSRLSKIADAYIEGILEKETYLEKKNHLLIEEQALKEKLDQLDEIEQQSLKRVEQFLELANRAYISYEKANEVERREFVKIVTSNLMVKEKKVVIKLEYPFAIVYERESIPAGSPQRGIPRTLFSILRQLCLYFREHELIPEEQKEQVKLSLDEAIIVGARKITRQQFTLKPTSELGLS